VPKSVELFGQLFKGSLRHAGGVPCWLAGLRRPLEVTVALEARQALAYPFPGISGERGQQGNGWVDVFASVAVGEHEGSFADKLHRWLFVTEQQQPPRLPDFRLAFQPQFFCKGELGFKLPGEVVVGFSDCWSRSVDRTA
jgi:hypothetical protein